MRALSTVDLGRATLARQHLLDRAPNSASTEITHLVGLQSQAPLPPYVGLWTRLAAFTTDDLSDLLTSRTAVRLATQRSTIHLVTADDALWLWALLEPVFAKGLRQPQHRRHLESVDLTALAELSRAALTVPRTPAELGAVLAESWPEVPVATLTQAARAVLPLVQVPPRGVWGASGPGNRTTWTLAQTWLGAEAPELTDPDVRTVALGDLVRRYLAAFGPATIQDAQQWSGLTGLRPAVDLIRAELVSFTGPDGREYLDLPDAPRPAADTPAPVRFLPEWDNLLLSHVDRSRVITPERRAAIFSANGIVAASVLVDGQVRARWSVDRAAAGTTILRVRPLDTRFDAGQLRGIEEEGARLLGFLAPGAGDHAVVVED